MTRKHADRHFNRIGRRLTAAEAAIDNARGALDHLHKTATANAKQTVAWLDWQLGLVVDDLRDASAAHGRLMRIAAGETELQDLDQL
ncbi:MULTISPECIES: hypothetical protein [unclassified Bradyrhizobium]|uniref:hypothetical protein n=1 Tax=unclassified Bradyrhizobium TaxID=2631580 RepID=UPI0028E8C4D9|nr:MULTISPECIES: hypothetical protein [unclassified Bradyrhizobium]